MDAGSSNGTSARYSESLPAASALIRIRVSIALPAAFSRVLRRTCLYPHLARNRSARAWPAVTATRIHRAPLALAHSSSAVCIRGATPVPRSLSSSKNAPICQTDLANRSETTSKCPFSSSWESKTPAWTNSVNLMWGGGNSSKYWWAASGLSGCPSIKVKSAALASNRACKLGAAVRVSLLTAKSSIEKSVGMLDWCLVRPNVRAKPAPAVGRQAAATEYVHRTCGCGLVARRWGSA